MKRPIVTVLLEDGVGMPEGCEQMNVHFQPNESGCISNLMIAETVVAIVESASLMFMAQATNLPHGVSRESIEQDIMAEVEKAFVSTDFKIKPNPGYRAGEFSREMEPTSEVTWDRTPPPQVSYQTHKFSFIDALLIARNRLPPAAREGRIAVTLGVRATEIVATLPQFTSTDNNFSAHGRIMQFDTTETTDPALDDVAVMSGGGVTVKIRLVTGPVLPAWRVERDVVEGSNQVAAKMAERLNAGWELLCSRDTFLFWKGKTDAKTVPPPLS